MKKLAMIIFWAAILITKVNAQSQADSLQGRNLIQLNVGTPYHWVQQFSRAFSVHPLRFSMEYIRWIEPSHRFGLTIDADYSNFWYQYAVFWRNGHLFRTSVFLQHAGLYVGVRTNFVRFPWKFDNGVFFEPQIGLGYEHARDHSPNVQLIARPQFVRLDWRFRLGAMLPLGKRVNVSPSVEFTRINGPYFKDFSAKFLAEVNLGFNF